MSGAVALTSAQLRERQLRREAVAALQRDRGLLQRCAEAAGLPALLPNFGLPHLIQRRVSDVWSEAAGDYSSLGKFAQDGWQPRWTLHAG